MPITLKLKSHLPRFASCFGTFNLFVWPVSITQHVSKNRTHIWFFGYPFFNLTSQRISSSQSFRQIHRTNSLARPPCERVILKCPELMNCRWELFTFQGINISHLGKRKIIFKMLFFWDMLVSGRVVFFFSQQNNENTWDIFSPSNLESPVFFVQNKTCPKIMYLRKFQNDP